MVCPEDPTPPRDYVSYDGPPPKTNCAPVIRYCGSILQPGLLNAPVIPPSKEAP